MNTYNLYPRYFTPITVENFSLFLPFSYVSTRILNQIPSCIFKETAYAIINPFPTSQILFFCIIPVRIYKHGVLSPILLLSLNHSILLLPFIEKNYHFLIQYNQTVVPFLSLRSLFSLSPVTFILLNAMVISLFSPYSTSWLLLTLWPFFPS